jgi:hypothetical protein
MYFNSLESIFLAALLFNSVVYVSLGTVFYLILSLCLLTLLGRDTTTRIEKKQLIININIVISFVLLITKLSLCVTSVADTVKDKDESDKNWLETFGFEFEEDGTVNKTSTVLPHILSWVISIFYKLQLKIIVRAIKGRARIKRTLTRIIPLTR